MSPAPNGFSMGSDLAGCRVLLTRPAERSAALRERLETLGASVAVRPTIEFREPLNSTAVADVVAAIETYDWIVLTSREGVTRLVDAAGEPPRSAKLAAVGPATARALRERGREADLVAEDPRADGLVETLVPKIRPGARVLVVRPEVAGDEPARGLAEHGAAVTSVAFYRTVPTAAARELCASIGNGDFDVAVFASPSSFEALLSGADVRARSAIAWRVGLERYSPMHTLPSDSAATPWVIGRGRRPRSTGPLARAPMRRQPARSSRR